MVFVTTRNERHIRDEVFATHKALAREYSALSLEAGFEREELQEIKETRWRDELNEALGERGRSIEEIGSNDSAVNWRIEVAADLRGRTDAPYRLDC